MAILDRLLQELTSRALNNDAAVIREQRTSRFRQPRLVILDIEPVRRRTLPNPLTPIKSLYRTTHLIAFPPQLQHLGPSSRHIPVLQHARDDLTIRGELEHLRHTRAHARGFLEQVRDAGDGFSCCLADVDVLPEGRQGCRFGGKGMGLPWC